jgi:hypothetical protein
MYMPPVSFKPTQRYQDTVVYGIHVCLMPLITLLVAAARK